MEIRFFIIKVFSKIIRIEILNILLRKLLKINYISQVIPKEIREAVPVSGKIDLQLPNSKKLYLKVDGRDTIANRLYWKGIDGFEKDTLLLFINLLKFTDTFLDIGTNTGIYALIAATDNPARKVYAFEPVPRIFRYLKRNVELNKVNNLQINSSAITNYDGEITLYIPSGRVPTSSSTAKGFTEANEVISVPALTIDSFVTMNHISKVDLMKIDTETTEHKVLEGARNVLERDEPIIICEVLKGKTEKYLHSLLDNTDYKYFLISKEGLVEKEQIEGDATYKNMNYLFITERKMQEINKRLIY
jgi:FkbM family methyltransferase